ncbi:RNase HII [Methylobacterium phyllostachyos]|uniref:Ribonuclease n=1 Tax=Methylobacterium phyllostachyos TaxID=582672 RepID=A0A1H0F3F0_9HYPH|nr:ribonuclease HII [Methylobacterium phyllostachyos]SDN89059.1 RNase HII [Methylobacterium phyllostachyos]
MPPARSSAARTSARVSARPFDPSRAAAYPPAIGCDEVGRGALCGPVVVAAVWFDPAAIPPDLLAALDDSKRLPEPERDRLAPLIRAAARVAVSAGSRGLIDRINIRAATLDAMARAVARLGIAAPVLVDGRDALPGLPGRAVVGGDRLVPQIAAASIVAKIFRDTLMRRLALRHPGYGWERNVGYGTAVHRAGLTRLGRSPHHRLSFTRGFDGVPQGRALGRDLRAEP